MGSLTNETNGLTNEEPPAEVSSGPAPASFVVRSAGWRFHSGNDYKQMLIWHFALAETRWWAAAVRWMTLGAH